MKEITHLKKFILHLPNAFNQNLAKKKKNLEETYFTKTFNPNHVIELSKITRILENKKSNDIKRCFQNKTVY